MLKGLDALENIETQFNQLGIKHKESGCHIREDDYFAIEKELKALEIIKNKCVDCWGFMADFKNMSDEEKSYAFSFKDLTKEEIDLLQEVLLWKRI